MARKKEVNYKINFKDSSGQPITEEEARKRMQEIYNMHYKPVKQGKAS